MRLREIEQRAQKLRADAVAAGATRDAHAEGADMALLRPRVAGEVEHAHDSLAVEREQEAGAPERASNAGLSRKRGAHWLRRLSVPSACIPINSAKREHFSCLALTSQFWDSVDASNTRKGREAA
jgi:hypothetical protein